MAAFWADLWRHAFLQHALLAGLLAAIACGAVGTLVVVRRSTYVAGAIAHCVLGGLGAAYWLQRARGLTWLEPMYGAIAAALLAALVIAGVSLSRRRRLDTALSALWALGMAVGISFIHATPGYEENLMSYLFGSILMVGGSKLAAMAVLDLVVVGTLLLCYDRFLAVGFHEELARLRGVRVGLHQTLLTLLVALTVVLLAQVVGVVMVIALITLPAATALRLTARLWLAMLLAGALCLLCIVGGILISYGPEWPVGPTIIECAGALYLTVVGGGWLVGRLRRRTRPAVAGADGATA